MINCLIFRPPSFHPSVRESPDTASVHIGGGPMDNDSPDVLRGIKGLEDDRHIYNPLLNRILENPTSLVYPLRQNILHYKLNQSC